MYADPVCLLLPPAVRKLKEEFVKFIVIGNPTMILASVFKKVAKMIVDHGVTTDNDALATIEKAQWFKNKLKWLIQVSPVRHSHHALTVVLSACCRLFRSRSTSGCAGLVHTGSPFGRNKSKIPLLRPSRR